MSYISNIGGKLTITAKGSIKIYAKENIEITSAKSVCFTGVENGVSFGKPEDGPPTPDMILDAKCIVQFRPRNSWKGKFGFDWFRIGDTNLQGDENYDNLIGQYYDKSPSDITSDKNRNSNSWTTFFQVDPQPTRHSGLDKLKKLKALYGEYSYSLENDASGTPVNKKYYKPVIALFPRIVDPADSKKTLESGEAELKILLEFQKVNGNIVKPDKVVFEMDNTLMDASHPLVTIDKHTILKKDLNNKEDIKITCLADFASDKEIKVWAITLDETGKQKTKLFAGILKMIAPSKRITKEVVIVRILNSAGTGSRKNLDLFERNLKQALISVNITEKALDKSGAMKDVLLDLRTATKNHLNINFDTEFNVKDGNIVSEEWYPPNNLRLQEYLKIELELKYPGQFTNHFKLFFLYNMCDLVEVKDASGNTLQSQSTLGFSSLNTDFGVMFKNHDTITIGHECMHGLGLQHSFYGNNYLYKALKTDNIMDYSHNEINKVTGATSTVLERVSTWYWQWDILNPNIID